MTKEKRKEKTYVQNIQIIGVQMQKVANMFLSLVHGLVRVEGVKNLPMTVCFLKNKNVRERERRVCGGKGSILANQ